LEFLTGRVAEDSSILGGYAVSMVNGYRHFEKIYRLKLQGRAVMHCLLILECLH
jgi:hypothetical protein